MVKTNAVRLLDSLAIQYELLNYEVDIEDLSALSTAQKLNILPKQLFKTLVVRGNSHNIYFAVIPSNSQLNFKALASLAEEKKLKAIVQRLAKRDRHKRVKISYRIYSWWCNSHS